MSALRVLVIEDSADDCSLLLRELRRGGYEPSPRRVESAADLTAALAQEWDIIFSDYAIPGFSGTQALDIVRASNRDVPFIFLSGTIGEDTAVAAIKRGAQDYIMKTNLKRLLPTIARELRDVELRRQHRRVETEQRALEARFRNILEIAVDAVIAVDEAMNIVIFNQGAERIFGYRAADILGKSLDLLIPQRYRIHERDSAQDDPAAPSTGGGREVSAIRHDGTEFPAETTVSKLVEGGHITYTVILRDITERKRGEQELHLLQTIALAVSAATNVDDALTVTLERVCAATGWELGQAWTPGVAGDRLECRAWRGNAALQPFHTASVTKSFARGEGLPGRVWQTRRRSLIKDISNEAAAHFSRAAAALASGLKAAIAIPVMADEEVIAVLEFFTQPLRDSDLHLLDSIGSVAAQLGSVIQRKRSEERLDYLAHHDVLTGLPNRVRFAERLHAAIDDAQRQNRVVAIAFLDLDRFKTINDSLGHETGDALLRVVAERLAQTIRPGDTVARLGGDEFGLIFANVAKLEDIDLLAHKILDGFKVPFITANNELFITASIGATLYPVDGEDTDLLLRNADVAMYRAKSSGRNTFQIYRTEMTSHVADNLLLENDLRRALERKQLVVHYQPQIDLSNGNVIAVEALVRWQHPTRGLLLPGQFIPLAEEAGLIVPIGAWVLREACRQNMAWRAAGLPPLRMAVNLSARQFLQPDLLAAVQATLAETGHAATALEIEITESVLMQNPDDAIEKLRTFNALGIRLALDDFGTGYSSLSYLKRFPVDTLKIDQSFVRDVMTDSDDAAIVSGIIALANSLRIEVVAEGVETAGQLEFLRQRHCNAVQGFYLSRPIEGAALAVFLDVRGAENHCTEAASLHNRQSSSDSL